VDSREVDSNAGLISDETIRLSNAITLKKYPDTLRLVVYEDFSTGNAYRFLTNNFKLEALTIAELYRERWQIELFFKWIKQHLHIKTFYGTSQNAVFTQIWIAICDYLLLIVAKKRYMLDPSLHSISNSIGQVLFKRGNIREIFNQLPLSNAPEEGEAGQLTLW
jgi:IS4 transposase